MRSAADLKAVWFPATSPHSTVATSETGSKSFRMSQRIFDCRWGTMVMMLSLKPPIVYPSTGGAACGGGRSPPQGRRVRAHRPVSDARGSDGGSLTTLAGQGEMWRRDVRPPSDW